MKPTVLLLPVLLAAPVFCAENSDLIDLLPADTQVAFGIHVRGVVDSELGRNLTAEIKGQTGDWQKLLEASGFDPLHDIDEVLIASTGSGKKAPTLVVARGRFDVAKLAPNAEPYNGVPLVTNKTTQGGDSVYGFLDSSTAVAGDVEMVKAAIDRRSQHQPLDSTFGAQLASYREHYEVWAVVNRMEGLEGYMPPSDSPASGPAAALNSIDRFQFGVSVKSGLELAAEVHARTDKDAEQLASTLQFLDAMTKAGQPAGSTGTKFSFKNENGTLKVSLSVSEADMKKAIENQRKAGMLFANRPAQARPPIASVTPVKPALEPPPVIPVKPAFESMTPVKPAFDLAPVTPVKSAFDAPPPPAKHAVVAPPAPPAAAPAPVQTPSRTVAPGNGPDTNSTAVFTLPGR